jgi:hypothetical protein
MIGRVGVFAAEDLDLLALEDGHVAELAGVVVDAVLHDEQARSQHFEHEAERRDGAGRAPDAERAPVAPDPEVDARPLDRGREAAQGARAEGHGLGQHQGRTARSGGR